jgi:hypothetical protein
LSLGKPGLVLEMKSKGGVEEKEKEGESGRSVRGGASKQAQSKARCSLSSFLIIFFFF